jgi:hypothetical protein
MQKISVTYKLLGNWMYIISISNFHLLKFYVIKNYNFPLRLAIYLLSSKLL